MRRHIVNIKSKYHLLILINAFIYIFSRFLKIIMIISIFILNEITYLLRLASHIEIIKSKYN